MEIKLGKSVEEISRIGLGCWPIGGNFFYEGIPDGYGIIDDKESVRAIHGAIDAGINFFDTADVYGAGHSEIVLGKAVREKCSRNKVIIATKFGNIFNSETKDAQTAIISPGYIRRALTASLKRLNTDYIDIYQIHLWKLPHETAEMAFDTLDLLAKEGLIRSYGWSTDVPECAAMMDGREHAAVIQHQCNVLQYSDDLIHFIESRNLIGLNRSPLGMGILSGKYSGVPVKFDANDVRFQNFEWNIYFKNGKPNELFLNRISDLREILTSNGRTLAQGSLAWLLAKSPSNVPLPGFRNLKQVLENAKVLETGGLTDDEMNQIGRLI
ncbi:MAG: aldo/keto reductase [Spirochaetes bacterium]|nr:aldo/keto reductase [Spirochaetota bacterium]